MKRVLQCAVVGLGRIGWQHHIPQILKHPGLNLAAVVDPDPTRLAEARTAFGVTRCHADCRELAQMDGIDLAVISSPTRFHREQTELLLRSGIDVFCDKPAALSCADVQAMAQTASENRRKLMVFQPHRLTGEALTAQAIIAGGKLGKLFMIRRSSNNYSRRNDWQAFQAQGGGMLFNYGAHYIDQFFYLAGGDRCARARCELRRVVSRGDADDVVRVLLTGESGLLYDLDINMAAALPLPVMALYGSRGTAMITGRGHWKLRYCPAEKLPELKADPRPAAPGRLYPGETLPWQEEEIAEIPEELDEYYRRCYAYYAEDAPPFVPLADTIEVMRTIELCRDDAQHQTTPERNL